MAGSGFYAPKPFRAVEFDLPRFALYLRVADSGGDGSPKSPQIIMRTNPDMSGIVGFIL